MNLGIISPVVRFAATTFDVRSAALLPLYETVLAGALDGTPLEFSAPNETKEVPVPIPRLAGLDDIEVERVGIATEWRPLQSRTEQVHVAFRLHGWREPWHLREDGQIVNG